MFIFAIWIMKQKRTIYQCASQWGLPFGLYLSCAAITSIFADYFLPLNILFYIMVLALPFIVYYFQRRKFIEDDGFTEYAALWMMGILLFILGMVIASFVAFFVLKYARPDFLYVQAEGAIKAYSQIPEMKDSEMLKVLKQMVDERLMPSIIDMVFSMFWFVSFSGSVISAITALVAQRSIKYHNNKL